MIVEQTSEYDTFVGDWDWEIVPKLKRIWMILLVQAVVALILFIQRKRAGLTLKEAALKAGVNPVMLRKFELGLGSPSGPTIPNLLNLYQANVEVQMLFCITPSRPLVFMRQFVAAVLS